MSSGGTAERLRDAEEQEAEREFDREVGRRRERREDRPLITGDAEYTDDFVDAETLHLAVVRSRFGHADVNGIDTSPAEQQEGVLAAFTAADLHESGAPAAVHVDGSLPEQKGTTFPLLAEEKVRYAGEAIAIVIAEDRYLAANAAEDVEVDFDRREAAVEIDESLSADAPVVHEEYDDNTAFDWEYGDQEATKEAFAEADHVASVEVTNQRVIPNAMEPRSALAEFDPDEEQVTMRLSTQVPHRARARIADVLGLEEDDLRVIAPDVGGGFGSKGGSPYAEGPLVAWASMQVGRPVKWVATRTEALQTDHHGRDMTAEAELAVDEDGSFRGLRVDAKFNIGSYLVWGSTPASNFRTLICGQYDFPAVDGHSVGALTNTTPIAPYRGAGRPEAIYVLERVVAEAADDLGMDPAELRRRNQIPSDAFPFESQTGAMYDSGNYQKALEKSLEHLEYDTWRQRQSELREEDRYVGIGVCCFVENTGSSPGRPELGRVRLKRDGTVVAHCGTSDHGQGHETTFSQVISDELGVPYEEIEIVEGDTDDLPEGVGTFGSRSAPVGASALVEAAEQVREQAAEIAGRHLETPPADLVFEDGVFTAEDGKKSVTIQEVGAIAHGQDKARDVPDLEASSSYDPPNLAYSFGTHTAVVEVDPTSGEVEILDYVAVDDCGTQFNPRIVEGQIMGGVAQGIGQALYEQAVYDSNGTLSSGSLQDYAMPKSTQIPDITVDETETPCPHNPTGAKGAGESGAIGAPPAVVNAAVDALRPFGVDDLDMPMTAESVWQTVKHAEE
jgi:carbon-monoxide dehydrogenase large subunit